MKRSKTNTGFLYFLEKIVRSHPLIYFIIRRFIIYTKIFEEDANGVIFLNLPKNVTVIDVGASDGIASKFFNRKLKINKIICFEPYKPYAKILKKLNIKNLKINTYGIGQYNKFYEVFFPRYKFFSKNFDAIPSLAPTSITVTFFGKFKKITPLASSSNIFVYLMKFLIMKYNNG